MLSNALIAAISVNIVESFCISFSLLLLNCVFVGCVIFCRASINSTAALTSIALVDNVGTFYFTG